MSIDEAYHDASKLKAIKAEKKKINGVFRVYYVEASSTPFNKNVTKIASILPGIAPLLLSTVVLLINNTVRLALFSQRFLIRHAVGGRHRLVHTKAVPILVDYHGLFGRAVASGLLVALSHWATRSALKFAAHQNTERLAILIVVYW